MVTQCARNHCIGKHDKKDANIISFCSFMIINLYIMESYFKCIFLLKYFSTWQRISNTQHCYTFLQLFTEVHIHTHCLCLEYVRIAHICAARQEMRSYSDQSDCIVEGSLIGVCSKYTDPVQVWADYSCITSCWCGLLDVKDFTRHLKIWCDFTKNIAIIFSTKIILSSFVGNWWRIIFKRLKMIFVFLVNSPWSTLLCLECTLSVNGELSALVVRTCEDLYSNTQSVLLLNSWSIHCVCRDVSNGRGSFPVTGWLPIPSQHGHRYGLDATPTSWSVFLDGMSPHGGIPGVRHLLIGEFALQAVWWGSFLAFLF